MAPSPLDCYHQLVYVITAEGTLHVLDFCGISFDQSLSGWQTESSPRSFTLAFNVSVAIVLPQLSVSSPAVASPISVESGCSSDDPEKELHPSPNPSGHVRVICGSNDRKLYSYRLNGDWMLQLEYVWTLDGLPISISPFPRQQCLVVGMQAAEGALRLTFPPCSEEETEMLLQAGSPMLLSWKSDGCQRIQWEAGRTASATHSLRLPAPPLTHNPDSDNNPDNNPDSDSDNNPDRLVLATTDGRVAYFTSANETTPAWEIGTSCSVFSLHAVGECLGVATWDGRLLLCDTSSNSVWLCMGESIRSIAVRMVRAIPRPLISESSPSFRHQWFATHGMEKRTLRILQMGVGVLPSLKVWHADLPATGLVVWRKHDLDRWLNVQAD